MTKKFLSTPNQFEISVEKCRAYKKNNHIDKALLEIKMLLKSVSAIPDSIMQFMPCERIDRELESIAMQWREGALLTKTAMPACDVLVITGALYNAGGHTREIEDWIPGFVERNQQVSILLSLPEKVSHENAIDGIARQVKCYSHNSQDVMVALEWLVQTLESINPNKIIISPFLDDVALFSAVACARVDSEIYWNLTLDHNVSPGLFLRAVDHIIVKRPYLYSVLKRDYQLDNVAYIPFSRKEERLQKKSQSNNHKIVMCSCTSSLYKIENEYVYRFEHIVANLIVQSEVEFIHIGVISERAKQYIYNELDANGVARDSFVHVPFADSLAEVFSSYGVSALLQTFPVGGGLVSIEAMQAGLMIINHHCYSTKLYNPSDFCYEGALLWDTPDHLYSLINNLSLKDLQIHRDQAERYSRVFNSAGNIENYLVEGVEFDVDVNAVTKNFSYPLDLLRVMANKSIRNYYPDRYTRTFSERLLRKWTKFKSKICR